MTAHVPAQLQPPETSLGIGTPEATWRSARFEEGLPNTTAEGLVPPGCRAVVVAPHPDDEVLGCGGLVASLAQAGRAPLIVSVTDGNAGARPGGAEDLARLRRDESILGLRELGVPEPSLRTLRFPEDGVADRERDLAARLRGILRPTDVVFVPWEHDGHPDHEAVHRATVIACDEVSAVRWDVPIWTWRWSSPGDTRVPWERAVVLLLDERVRARKRRAITAHRSQLADESARGLSPTIRAPFERDFEIFFRNPNPARRHPSYWPPSTEL